jgi:hypothetical protein
MSAVSARALVLLASAAVLIRHQLIDAKARRRKSSDDKR